jgi:hypothetical protein
LLPTAERERTLVDVEDLERAKDAEVERCDRRLGTRAGVRCFSHRRYPASVRL